MFLSSIWTMLMWPDMLRRWYSCPGRAVRSLPAAGSVSSVTWRRTSGSTSQMAPSSVDASSGTAVAATTTQSNTTSRQSIPWRSSLELSHLMAQVRRFLGQCVLLECSLSDIARCVFLRRGWHDRCLLTCIVMKRWQDLISCVSRY